MAGLLQNIPLSRTTVQRRIVDLGMYIESKLKQCFSKCKYFSISLDESTDKADNSQLLIYLLD